MCARNEFFFASIDRAACIRRPNCGMLTPPAWLATPKSRRISSALPRTIARKR
jgi:hypothetical protein